MFELFDYTRNGLFFAPIFFILGALARNIRPARLKSALLFAGFLALTIIEGLILRRAQYPKHDSMYIMLVPCVFSFFYFWRHLRKALEAGPGYVAVYIYTTSIVDNSSARHR